MARKEANQSCCRNRTVPCCWRPHTISSRVVGVLLQIAPRLLSCPFPVSREWCYGGVCVAHSNGRVSWHISDRHTPPLKQHTMHPECIRLGSVLMVNLTRAPTTFPGILISVQHRGPDTSFGCPECAQMSRFF